MNDHSAGYAELPRTAYLDHTLRRAWNAAQQRSHRYVTLEHLLLALLDDPDATELLQAVDADIPIIQSSVATAINNNTALVAPGATAPAFSYKFDNLFAGAFEDAVRAGRKEIDGAFVLVAVAKHPDSDAASILAANGFNAQAAQRTLEALLGPSPQASGASGAPPARPSQGKNAAKPKPEGQRSASAPRAPSAADPKTPAPQQGGGTGTGDRFMEAMLASVRSILDSENRKEWALAPMLNPAATQPVPARQRQQPPVEPQPPAQPRPRAEPQRRAEPQLRAEALANGQRAPTPPPAQAPLYAQERPNPASRPPIVSPALRPPPPPPPAPELTQGFAERKVPAFDLELHTAPAPQERPLERERPPERLQERPLEKPREKPQEKPRKSPAAKPSRGQREPGGALAKALEDFPRSVRLARGEVVRIQLGKEEAGQLFARPAQQAAEAQAAARAVSIRLSAPEGGFFIETMSPETQWLSNRPGSPGEEQFGTWSWAVVPNETGWRVLSVSVSVRDIEANGVLSGSQETEQAIKIRVRTNFGRLFGGMIRTLFLLAAGGGLAAAAWYVLKTAGKLSFQFPPA